MPWREKLRNWPKPVEKKAVKKEPAAVAVGGPTQEQIAKRLEEVEEVGAEGEKAEKVEKADADNQEAAEESPDKEEEKKMVDVG